jgi:hypothetical protein
MDAEGNTKTDGLLLVLTKIAQYDGSSFADPMDTLGEIIQQCRSFSVLLAQHHELMDAIGKRVSFELPQKYFEDPVAICNAVRRVFRAFRHERGGVPIWMKEALRKAELTAGELRDWDKLLYPWRLPHAAQKKNMSKDELRFVIKVLFRGLDKDKHDDPQCCMRMRVYVHNPRDTLRPVRMCARCESGAWRGVLIMWLLTQRNALDDREYARIKKIPVHAAVSGAMVAKAMYDMAVQHNLHKVLAVLKSLR